jgi:hypothetical protein
MRWVCCAFRAQPGRKRQDTAQEQWHTVALIQRPGAMPTLRVWSDTTPMRCVRVASFSRDPCVGMLAGIVGETCGAHDVALIPRQYRHLGAALIGSRRSAPTLADPRTGPYCTSGEIVASRGRNLSSETRPRSLQQNRTCSILPYGAEAAGSSCQLALKKPVAVMPFMPSVSMRVWRTVQSG